jgi:hypothetical protein
LRHQALLQKCWVNHRKIGGAIRFDMVVQWTTMLVKWWGMSFWFIHEHCKLMKY